MGYACDLCFSIMSAVTGWLYKTGKKPKGGRWRCQICNGPWSGESEHAVAYVLTWGNSVLTFYGRWGFSNFVQKTWPEVAERWRHWSTTRLEYYAKYEPQHQLRDAAIETHGSMRLIVHDTFQKHLHNHMLSFYSDKVDEVNDYIWAVYRRRQKFYTATMGRWGTLRQAHSGVQNFLKNKDFCRRNKIQMGSNGGARKNLYFLSKEDFAGNYMDDQPEAMTKAGGGRVKRSAFNRVFPQEIQGPELNAEWACDDEGNPEN
jgi:hypothetical protein